MRTLRHSFRVRAPLEEVSLFHQDTRALKRLTPPPAVVQIHEFQPVAENAVARFTLWLGPIPVDWVAVHHNVDLLQGFEDIQSSGPFEYWKHEHRFIPVTPALTEVVDEITLQPAEDSWRRLIGEFIWMNLPLMFAYRGWITRRVLEGKQ